MDRVGGKLWRSGQALGLFLVLCSGFGADPPRAAKTASPALWIAADRIVGFVPFTVYVYGKVVGAAAGHLELCRSETAWIAESANARRVEEGSPRTGFPQPPRGPQCDAGRVTPTPDGIDYSHDLRFDRPGTYQIRLVMIDDEGERVVSNAVRVRAF